MEKERHTDDFPYRGTLLLAAVATVILVALPVPLAAQEESEDNVGFAVASGRITFQRYCASCHGREGRGDGSVGQYLTVRPTDLTGLRTKYDGEFPLERVSASVDGRETVRGHGTSEMPVWGEVFQSSLAEPQPLGEEGEERAGRIIRQLVLYLRSIQAED